MDMRRLAHGVELAAFCALGSLDLDYVARYLRSPSPPVSLRLLRRFGSRVGEGARVKGSLLLDNFQASDGYRGDFSNLQIAEAAYLGEAVYLDLADTIDIGEGAMLSAGCRLVTHQNVHRSSFLQTRFPTQTRQVRICHGAWLGAAVTVLPGVTIGRESAVAAGAVVVDDVEPRTLVAGVPARHMRSL